MESQKKIRWQQRFENLKKAFVHLENAVEIDDPNEIEIQGIIQVFEFTFELSWKTLKDLLESEEIVANSPREVLKNAFEQGYIEDGKVWIDMLEKRNLLTHTYQAEVASLANTSIHTLYFFAIEKLVQFLKTKEND